MCNAWNHPIGCTCGWGGEGHLGGGNINGGGYFSWHPDIYRKEYNSYIIPNAKCPVCSAKVFFYKSPFGGRVFFDDLGPPWPKHPCTDKNRDDDYLLLLNKSATKPEWEKKGWLPACLIKIGHRKNKELVCFRIFEKRNRRIVQTLLNEEIEKLRKEGVLLFYRNIDKASFDLSVFDFEKNSSYEITLNYFGETKWK